MRAGLLAASLTALAALAGCAIEEREVVASPVPAPVIAVAAPAPEADPAIQGTIDSGVNRLTVGMSSVIVEQVLGAPAAAFPDPAAPELTCVSYLYDEMVSARWAHVTYRDGTVVRASDGHRTVCGGRLSE